MSGPSSRSVLGGNSLLRAVYAELQLSLGELFSPKDLLLAAQKLIDISKSEYADGSFQDEIPHNGYYTRDVDHMIKHHPWVVAEHEDNSTEFYEDENYRYRQFESRVRHYHNPDRYYHRG